MKDCAHIVPLIGAREGELAPEERAARDAHLAGCADCRAREAEAQALGALVREGLMAKANARDFAPFVDGVMERIASERSRAPRARASILSAHPERDPFLSAHPERSAAEGRAKSREGGLGLFAWIDRHRKMTLAALAPVLAAAVVVVYVRTRPGPPQMAAAMELTSEGDATMVLETSDGPLVLLGEGEENS